MSNQQQNQISCPYFRQTVFINNGQHMPQYACSEVGNRIDPSQYCFGDKCPFPKLVEEKKEEKKDDNNDTKTSN